MKCLTVWYVKYCVPLNKLQRLWQIQAKLPGDVTMSYTVRSEDLYEDELAEVQKREPQVAPGPFKVNSHGEQKLGFEVK